MNNLLFAVIIVASFFIGMGIGLIRNKLDEK